MIRYLIIFLLLVPVIAHAETETFNSTGYDLSWTEYLETAGTIDEDDSTEINSFPCGGTYDAEIVSDSGYTYADHSFTAETGDFYTRIYIKVTAENLTDTYESIFEILDTSTVELAIRLIDTSGALTLAYRYDSTTVATQSSIALNETHYVDIYGNCTSGAWGFRFDGVSVETGTGFTCTELDRLRLGSYNSVGSTRYYNNIETGTSGYIGAITCNQHAVIQ